MTQKKCGCSHAGQSSDELLDALRNMLKVTTDVDRKLEIQALIDKRLSELNLNQE